MNRIVAGILVACSFALAASAAGPTLLPFRFSAGNPIKSGEINANFDALATADSDLSSQLALMRAEIDSLRAQVGSNQSTSSSSFTTMVERLTTLETNTCGITCVGSDVVIEGRNLIVRDGHEGPCVLGVGNILVGRECNTEYAESNGCEPIRTGSNNVVIGGGHQYCANGSLMVGSCNSSEANGTVVFGKRNRSVGCYATVCGGEQNSAVGDESVVGGGTCRNVTSGLGWEVGNTSNTISGGFLPEIRARRFVNR